MGSKSAADLPGPNVYDSNSKRFVLKSAPAFGFGTSKRPQSSSTTKNQVPGPGNYQLKTIVGSESQGQTLQGRHTASKTTIDFNPGPGTYNPPNPSATLTASPGWRIGSAKRQPLNPSRIGPSSGAYNPDYKVIKSKMSLWSFGSSKRQQPKGTYMSTPAPTKYNLPSKVVEGPKFHMGLKLDNMSSIGQAVN